MSRSAIVAAGMAPEEFCPNWPKLVMNMNVSSADASPPRTGRERPRNACSATTEKANISVLGEQIVSRFEHERVASETTGPII